jgi:putative addiction module CopG family antidote
MNVSLTSQLESNIRQKVASGMYNSASEAMWEALRLMAEKDAVQSIKLGALRNDIQHRLSAFTPAKAGYWIWTLSRQKRVNFATLTPDAFTITSGGR